jgi:hypothetical protein
MARYTVKREGMSFIIVDTYNYAKVDAAPTRIEAEKLRNKWERRHG